MLKELKPIYFGSGLSKKFPNWKVDIFNSNILNRSHIYSEVQDYIKNCLDMIRYILKIPADYKIIFTPGSGSGAITCAFYNFLENENINLFDSGFFSNEWRIDLENVYSKKCEIINFNNKQNYDLSFDRVLVHVDTTTGLCHENFDFLPNTNDNDAITIVDGVSSAFLENIPWQKFDVFACSLQKILAGDGGTGILVMSPKALKRLNKEKSAPRLFNINRWGLEALENGRMMSSPSMLSIVELHSILNWIIENGGLGFLQKRNNYNWEVVNKFLLKNKKFVPLIKNSAQQGKALMCLELAAWNNNEKNNMEKKEKMEFVKEIASKAYEIKVYDIANFNNPSWRFWIGPTQEAQDVELGLERFANVF